MLYEIPLGFLEGKGLREQGLGFRGFIPVIFKVGLGNSWPDHTTLSTSLCWKYLWLAIVVVNFMLAMGKPKRAVSDPRMHYTSEVMRNFDREVLSNAMAGDFNDFLHVVWIPTMTFWL